MTNTKTAVCEICRHEPSTESHVNENDPKGYTELCDDCIDKYYEEKYRGKTIIVGTMTIKNPRPHGVIKL